MDESLLTGESLPVRKQANLAASAQTDHRPGGEDFAYVYSGTLIVQGQGIAQVYATGIQTEMGKIGKALQTVVPEDIMLQRETWRMVEKLTFVAIAICMAVVVIYGATKGDWLQGLLAGLALAMAILPNEIPVVLTIFLALGAWRFSQARVLTRRTPVVETLEALTPEIIAGITGYPFILDALSVVLAQLFGLLFGVSLSYMVLASFCSWLGLVLLSAYSVLIALVVAITVQRGNKKMRIPAI